MTQRVDQFLQTQLEILKTKQRYRQLLECRPNFINLISNDYHGFSQIPIQTQTASGAGGSRLLGGNHPALQALETTIQTQLPAEACLIFPSGFQCHHTVLQTLLGTQQFAVLYDHLNHASLYSGISRATLRYRFRHNDVLDCQKKLEVIHHQHPHLIPMIILESIHSMDGSVSPLTRFIEIKQKYNAWLVLDEAHAIGICGNHHLGVANSLERATEIDVLLGTFSKGLGAMGAFVATRSTIAQYLINTAKGFIYTTALSPALAETIHHRLHELNAHPLKTQVLRSRITDFMSLSEKFSLHHPYSPIFSLQYPSIDRLYRAAHWLEDHHIAVGIIRPPTYPVPMLRICINSGLSESLWEKTLDCFTHFFTQEPR